MRDLPVRDRQPEGYQGGLPENAGEVHRDHRKDLAEESAGGFSAGYLPVAGAYDVNKFAAKRMKGREALPHTPLRELFEKSSLRTFKNFEQVEFGI